MGGALKSYFAIAIANVRDKRSKARHRILKAIYLLMCCCCWTEMASVGCPWLDKHEDVYKVLDL